MAPYIFKFKEIILFLTLFYRTSFFFTQSNLHPHVEQLEDASYTLDRPRGRPHPTYTAGDPARQHHLYPAITDVGRSDLELGLSSSMGRGRLTSEESARWANVRCNSAACKIFRNLRENVVFSERGGAERRALEQITAPTTPLKQVSSTAPATPLKQVNSNP